MLLGLRLKMVREKLEPTAEGSRWVAFSLSTTREKADLLTDGYGVININEGLLEDPLILWLSLPVYSSGSQEAA